MQVDFLARQPYFIDHLAPIWNKLDASERGKFYVLGAKGQEYAARKLHGAKIYSYIDEGECGSNPIVCAAYGDALRAADHDPDRQVILMEHGVGLTFGKAAYADGLGQRGKFSLIPVQSQYVLGKVNPELSHIPHPIIGVPKLDPWLNSFKTSHPIPKHPTVAIAFHHGDRYSRPGEVGSAWQHFIDVLPLLSKHYRLIVHAHPSSGPELLNFYSQWGLEHVEDWEQVMAQADLFINDCSSTAYEFCATGKPVILLNAPWFNRKSQYGIRFWDYSDIGVQIDEPGLLENTIEHVLVYPAEHAVHRQLMVRDLFPYFGQASDAAVQEIKIFLNRHKPAIVPVPSQKIVSNPIRVPTTKIRTSMDRGILYMCFGGNACIELARSITSLRTAGSDLPVVVVADKQAILWGSETKELDGQCKWMLWEGECPFDPSRNSNFHFRAGRVKPFLHEYSPFKETMYIDADTEFLVKPDEAFGLLQNWDFLVAQERLSLAELYNQRGAGWEHDISERNATIEDFGGGTGEIPFINSGLFFWKENAASKKLFSLWHSEWSKFKGWDEQKALMRALNHSKVRVLVLSEMWNYPHREEMAEKVHKAASIILHEYGRGAARTDVAAKGDRK